MPRKEWLLIGRDILFYVTGKADVAEADWRGDMWRYPTDWGYQLDRESEYFLPKDPAGVPMREFPPPLGVRYLPSRIAGYGFAHWNRWSTTRDARHRTEFLAAADWFLSAQQQGRFHHDFPLSGLLPGWLSCNAQGEAASVLARATVLTGDARYLDAARAAVHWLTVPVAEGGLRSELPDGSTFVEEYPGTEYQHVLNGSLYAAIGIADVLRAQTAPDPALGDFFQALVGGIGANLPAWDDGGWSTYDYGLCGGPRNLNTMTYQVIQVVMLRHLAAVSGDARLAATADRWEAAAASLPHRMTALARKLKYRLASRW